MKRSERGNILRILVILLITCFLTGCKGNDEESLLSSVGEMTAETGEQPEVITSQRSTGNMTGSIESTFSEKMIEDLEGEKCPAGYVYDYQVSMEPIPEEIAALGGPCRGTIHAFPSKIGMALTELEMEKDPMLKTEVEKRIPEIEAALEKEIEGDFAIEGVILLNEITWVFFCTEIETNYQFDLYYANNEYFLMNNKNININVKNVVDIADYYDEKESITLREVLVPMIREVYKDGFIKVRLQKDVDTVDIAIAQYNDIDVNKCMEQEKILLLWEKLQLYDETLDYNLNITFYPPQYSNVIEEKYNSMFKYDFSWVYSEKYMELMSGNKEVWCCFNYLGRTNRENENNLNALLLQRKDENYSEDIIWDYWIP